MFVQRLLDKGAELASQTLHTLCFVTVDILTVKCKLIVKGILINSTHVLGQRKNCLWYASFWSASTVLPRSESLKVLQLTSRLPFPIWDQKFCHYLQSARLCSTERY